MAPNLLCYDHPLNTYCQNPGGNHSWLWPREVRSLAVVALGLLLMPCALFAQKEWVVYQPFGPTLLWSVAFSQASGEFVAVGPQRQVAWDVNISVLEDQSSEQLNGAYSLAVNGSVTVVAQILQEGIGHSTDRESWAQYLPGESFWGVAHGNGRFVVVGTGGRIATVSDALDDWSGVTIDGITTNLYAVCFAEGRFLTGNGDMMLTSTDGSEWEISEVDLGVSVRAMAYGRDRYVLVGASGAVMVSDDGVNWSPRDSGTTSSLRSVVFGDGLFVAVGGNGSVIYSIDRGDTWNTVVVGTSQQINAITFGDGMFHAVTSGGQVLASQSIMTPPAIVVEVADREVLAGSNVQLEISASGTAPLSYSWSRDGVAIEGEVSSRLELPSVSEADEGTYTVTVFNPAGTVTGRPAFLNVLPVDMPPEIVEQPSSPAALEDDLFELAVLADGTAPLRYRWFKGAQWLSDVTGPVLTVASAALSDAGRYSVVVSNDFGEVRSREVVVSVTPMERAPEIIVQPSGGTVFAGQVFEMRVSARSWPPPVYQWLREGVELVGQKGSILRFSPVQMADAGAYRIRVSNSLGVAVSDVAVLVTALAPFAPIVVVQPRDSYAILGETLELAARIDGHPEPSVRWIRDGEPIIGANTEALSVASVRLEDGGLYWIEATNSKGSVTSRVVEVVVGDGLPRLLEIQGSQTVPFGDPLTLTVLAEGPGLMRFQWFQDGVLLPEANESVLEIESVDLTRSGFYAVEVANDYGSVRSNPVSVEVVPMDFSGVWMGGVGDDGDTGWFALFVRSDRSMVILGQEANGGVIRDRGAGIAQDGSFKFISDVDFETPYRDQRPDASGILSKSGVVGYTSAGVRLFGSRAPDDPVRSLPGFYSAGLSGTAAGEVSLIADGDGRYVLTLEDRRLIGSASGRVDPSGRASFAFDGGTVEFRLDPDSRRLSGTWMMSDGQTLVFAGLRDVAGSGEFLTNTSLRGVAGDGASVMVSGFVIEGDGPQPVLIRGIGPGLRRFGVRDSLGRVNQRLFRRDDVLAEAGDWGASVDAARIEAWSVLAGAFPLEQGLGDSALTVNLDSGAYTVHLGSSSGAGIGLTEVYLIPGLGPNSSRACVVNLSARMRVSGGEGVIIVGFVISGEVPRRLLIRAVGPGLASFGVNGWLADPVLILNREGVRITMNENWEGADGRAIPAGMFDRIGAFHLESASRDAALLRWLEPGIYTAEVRSADASAGLVLAEVYVVP